MIASVNTNVKQRINDKHSIKRSKNTVKTLIAFVNATETMYLRPLPSYKEHTHNDSAVEHTMEIMKSAK